MDNNFKEKYSIKDPKITAKDFYNQIKDNYSQKIKYNKVVTDVIKGASVPFYIQPTIINIRRREDMNNTTNKEIQNYDIFDHLLLPEMDNIQVSILNHTYICDLYNSLKIRKKEVRREYKKILNEHNKIAYSSYYRHYNRYNIIPKDRSLLDLFEMKVNRFKQFDSSYVMTRLSDDYRKSILHAYELELCFLNKNIKRLKKIIRNNKEWFRFNEDNNDILV